MGTLATPSSDEIITILKVLCEEAQRHQRFFFVRQWRKREEELLGPLKDLSH